MPSFGAASLKQRETLHTDLQRLLDEAILTIDFSIVEGHRGEELQNRDFALGKSKLRWPDGKHNSKPSKAVDISPYPQDWSEGELPHARFAFLAGVIWQIATRLQIKIRWGADWNRNLDPRDEKFLDWGHIELV